VNRLRLNGMSLPVGDYLLEMEMEMVNLVECAGGWL
jgi:hypothetical protein